MVIRWLGAFSLVLMCVATAGCSREPRELHIGVAMPLSGPMAGDGQSMVNAAQLASEHIAAKGQVGTGMRVKVAIHPVDDQDEDASAKMQAEALVSQGVSAVIGHLSSGTSIAAAPVYAQAGVPQLSMGTHPGYTKLGFKTTFRLLANDNVQAQALARYSASQFKGQGFAVIDDGSVYGKNLAQATAEELERAQQRIIHRRSYDPTASDFADLTASLSVDNAPKVIVTTMEVDQVTRLMRFLAQTGRAAEVTVIGGDTLKAGVVPAEAALLRGYLSTTPVTDVRETGSLGLDFVSAYKMRFGRAPADAAHYVYDATYLLAQAAGREESTRPAALLKALKYIDPVLPVTGYLRFRDDGELRFGAISLYAAHKGSWRLVTRGTQW